MIATMAPTIPFTLTGHRYDQDTFLGRLRAIIDLFNPKQLFRSEAEIEGVCVLSPSTVNMSRFCPAHTTALALQVVGKLNACLDLASHLHY